MTLQQNKRTARIDLQVTVESQQRFAAIHKELGFKTKTQTFEAIVFSISAQDVIDLGMIERMDTKLDQALALLDALT